MTMGSFSTFYLRYFLLCTAIINGVPSTWGDGDESSSSTTDPCNVILEGDVENWLVRAEEGELLDHEIDLAMACLTSLKNTSPPSEFSSLFENRELYPPLIRQPRQADMNHRTGPIYPGTKWCGPGNAARSFWELGQLSKEDKCCREHDYCPEQIVTGECLDDLCNTAPFTRSHCRCDERFRRCLRSLKTHAADTIGAIYFNVGNSVCFAEDYDNHAIPERKTSNGYHEDEHGRNNFAKWNQNEEGLTKSSRLRRTIECSRLPNCQYRFYAQYPYTESSSSTSNDNQQLRISREQPESLYTRDIDRHGLYPEEDDVVIRRSNREITPELISRFFHSVLKSTGILKQGFY